MYTHRLHRASCARVQLKSADCAGTTSELTLRVPAQSGAKLRVTHQYSEDVGAVLATVKGVRAVYRLKGDEIYVRAQVTSTKRVKHPRGVPEFQSAWVQPIAGTKTP